MVSSTHIRALVLLSGGLDSQLAARLLKSQGIEITGIVFQSIFFSAQTALEAGRRLAIPVRVMDFNEIIIGLLKHPGHGFGSAMNPCIDCHTAMIAQAGKIMRAENFHFVATGEVLNERPMSQNRRSLKIVAVESGLEGYLLRPLSARLLDMTEPEKNKWVDREKLCAISGRNRKPQFALAQQFGITDYPQPAGGCLLTDPGYGKKLRDLKEHEGLDDLAAIKLLRVGRHFRLGKQAEPGSPPPATTGHRNLKLIVGPDQAENKILEQISAENAILLKTANVPGPNAVLASSASVDEIQLAAAICARYADHKPGATVAIEASRGNDKKIIEVLPAEQSTIDSLRV